MRSRKRLVLDLAPPLSLTNVQLEASRRPLTKCKQKEVSVSFLEDEIDFASVRKNVGEIMSVGSLFLEKSTREYTLPILLNTPLVKAEKCSFPIQNYEKRTRKELTTKLQ